MFCVGCGDELQSSWQHCPSCGTANVKGGGAPKASKTSSSDGQRAITDAEAKKLLSTTSYAHWQASGKPEVIFEDKVVIGFDLTDKAVAVEFLRFAMWFVGTEDFGEWQEAGYPLMDYFFEELEHYQPQGYTLQTQAEIEAQLDDETLKIWKKAGKPKIAKSPEGEWVHIDNFGRYKWAMVTDPITDEDIFGGESDTGVEPEEEESADEVQYIQSDAEFKQWFSRADFKSWKKYGRPSAVVINSEIAMLEVQWLFYQHYGYQMSGTMVDGWFFAGCPDITMWDIEGTMRIYQETIMNMMGLQAQNRADNWAGITSSISSGLSDVGNALLRNAGQSGGGDGGAERIRDALKPRCSRCGQPKPGSVCAYCQGRER